MENNSEAIPELEMPDDLVLESNPEPNAPIGPVNDFVSRITTGQGRIRANLMRRRADFTSRSVVGPSQMTFGEMRGDRIIVSEGSSANEFAYAHVNFSHNPIPYIYTGKMKKIIHNSDISKYFAECDSDDIEKLNDDNECSICYNLMTLTQNETNNSDKNLYKDKVMKLSCNHMFHHDCIKSWMMKKLSCPCCRRVPSTNFKKKIEKNISHNDLNSKPDRHHKINIGSHSSSCTTPELLKVFNTITRRDTEFMRLGANPTNIEDFIAPEPVIPPITLPPSVYQNNILNREEEKSDTEEDNWYDVETFEIE